MTKYNYKKSSKRIILVLIALFVISGSTYSQGSKNTRETLQQKKKKINEQIAEINTILNETKASKRNSMGVLVNINMKLAKRQELIVTINAEINELNKEIRKNEQKSEVLKANLTKLKDDYKKMILAAQRNQDSYNNLMFIFAASDFKQAYSRLKYFQQYSDYRKKQAVEIIRNQDSLLANLKLLKDQRLEKNMLLGNEEQEKELLSKEKGQQEQVLTELQMKEKELKAELEKKKQETIQLQLAIKRLIEEEIKRKMEEAKAKAKAEADALAAKKAKEGEKKNEGKKTNNNNAVIAKTPDKPDPKTESKSNSNNMPELSDEAVALSADFANNRGRLPWPVGKGIICETYGEHEHPAIKGFMIVNNGIEICTAKGMQVRAVFDGEVTGIALSPTGGKLVIIRHGEYLSVYSNLGDVQVKTGQKISVKQVIGSVLYNEDEDKNSVNFQVWKGQKTMDPGGWLSGGK
jgi:murein hydrolase activator